jgi:hypothetical protein
MCVAELRTFITQNGLASAFDIYDTDSTGKPIISTARNILDCGSITLDEVKSCTRGIQEWGEDHKVWAETIAMQLVSNSCDPDLHQRVTEHMIGVDDYDIGGSTFFKIAIECITSRHVPARLLRYPSLCWSVRFPLNRTKKRLKS